MSRFSSWQQKLIVRFTLAALLITAICPPTGICFCEDCECDKSYSFQATAVSDPFESQSPVYADDATDHHRCCSLSCHATLLPSEAATDILENTAFSSRPAHSGLKRSANDCGCFCASVDAPPVALPGNGTVFDSVFSTKTIFAAIAQILPVTPFDLSTELLAEQHVAPSVRLHILHLVLRI